jgi:hypothetical protein
LAVFGRRPVEPAERLALSASKNQHKRRLMQCSKRLPKEGHANPVVDFDQCTKPLQQKSRLRALAVR